ncbi:MAG: DNA-directed RNA polymerase subunit beta' [Candidatus Aureabacteria bacterium]|nr:DNA-directed RNA polymerase subunit beta' [Candidatus Auribacterota bacterium]
MGSKEAADQKLAKAFLGLDKEEGAFDRVTIKIASPEVIRSWSKGEVKNPETINYRTFKPEKGGLFCERIFGPTRDWECSCGKYKRIKHKGVVCDRCGVEVTQSRVRRERMGHIELAVPVSHIWFFKTQPSRIGNILDLSTSELERVLYYEDYIVSNPGESPLVRKQLLNEEEYQRSVKEYGRRFKAGMGAEAIRELLKTEDLNALSAELQIRMDKTTSKQTKKKLSKRLQIVEGFKKSGNKPEWMVLSVIPVIPPDLRPLVPLEGGRFATSDLNDLYRRVINRNNRLKAILELKTPEVIIRNEKRMLQEAVDALMDNGRHGRPILGAGNRPLKSLSDMLKGKQGRFRQNLLGKRVDYSGRSVIVVGPELKLHQCGLPKKMALELFEPFIIRELKGRGLVHTIRSAKKMIEKEIPEVWDILEQVTKGHPVMLNRAPTLHRLGIQAFEPVLIEGKAIRIHPLVCSAFNADFDGDQMAVHVPLSYEAQMEAKLLMLAPNNIFSPSSGKPIDTPTQDIALGCYYVTKELFGGPPPRSTFSDREEVMLAYDLDVITLHEKVRVRLDGRLIETSAGRVMFNEILPREIGYVNEELNKKKLAEVIMNCYRAVGKERTVEILDKMKDLGFQEATRAGISIATDDMVIPPTKGKIIQEANKEVHSVEKQYRSGSITDGERYNKIVDIWTHTTDSISEALYRGLATSGTPGALNPIFIMVDSGARGSKQQIRQLAGMRGLMAKPSGEIIESPITSNFREGLSVLEYFISTHGARKGLADTALKTADSGYLTRRLVDVAQDVIIMEQDCGTLNGITVKAIHEGDDVVVSLKERILGRTSLEDIVEPVSKDVLVAANDPITEERAEKIEEMGIEQLKIRSVLTCESKRGVCKKCYGYDLSTGKEVELGTSVGIIAAQSIGEPGTQLTMRTFHIGGTASQVFKQPQIIAKSDGIIKFHNMKVVMSKEGMRIVVNKNGTIRIHEIVEDEKSGVREGRELESYTLLVGSVLAKGEGEKISKGEVFVKWDPYNTPILTEKDGLVEFIDIHEGVTMKKEADESTGLIGRVIMEHKENLHPQIVITSKDRKEVLGYYTIPPGAHIMVDEADFVTQGSLLAKSPRKISKTKDITGGLPRVAELFEARRPKDAAEIAKIDGIVEFQGTAKGRRKLVVRNEITGVEEEHLIPFNKHLVVYKGDGVIKGQQLTEGPIVPQELLQVCGPKDLQEYLVNQVQEVYRLQGVEINDKHIEVIIRQMLRKVRIVDPGDGNFLFGEHVEKHLFDRENERLMKKDKKAAEASPMLLGITKASLGTESFISAASFQETTRVLTHAAATGRTDVLNGFKENVIMGHLIPAGSGFKENRMIDVIPLVEGKEAALIAAQRPAGEASKKESAKEAEGGAAETKHAASKKTKKSAKKKQKK